MLPHCSYLNGGRRPPGVPCFLCSLSHERSCAARGRSGVAAAPSAPTSGQVPGRGVGQPQRNAPRARLGDRRGRIGGRRTWSPRSPSKGPPRGRGRKRHGSRAVRPHCRGLAHRSAVVDRQQLRRRSVSRRLVGSHHVVGRLVVGVEDDPRFRLRQHVQHERSDLQRLVVEVRLPSSARGNAAGTYRCPLASPRLVLSTGLRSCCLRGWTRQCGHGQLSSGQREPGRTPGLLAAG